MSARAQDPGPAASGKKGVTLVAHAAAEAFPMMGEHELNALAVDIAQNGLRQPIVLTTDGFLLDGRNRMEACKRVKVTPVVETYDGDPWTYSRSVNLWRRNMTTGQRAAACAISLVAEGKRNDGRWVRGSVPQAEGDTSKSGSKDWPQRMAEAGFVHDWIPDALLAVRDGTLLLGDAYKKAKAAEDKKKFEEEQERKKREAELAAGDAELSTLVGMWHSELALDFALMEQATDPDVWKGVRNLSDKVEQLRKRLKEIADVRLES